MLKSNVNPFYSQKKIESQLKSAIQFVWIKGLKEYVGSQRFIEGYSEDLLALMGEAVYWSVQLGLDELILKMKLEQILKYSSFDERFLNPTERTKYLEQVVNKLKLPITRGEVTFALDMAALCHFIHKYGYEQVSQMQSDYLCEKESRPKAKL